MLIPFSHSSKAALIMFSAYILHSSGERIHPCRTPFPYVGDSIVRKTDARLNKGDDVVVCLPGARIEHVTERESGEDNGKKKWRNHSGSRRDEQRGQGGDNGDCGQIQEASEEDEGS